MTALVALENAGLDDQVTIPGAAVGVEGTSLYLTEGETVTVRELLYGLMLQSGNDAAVALAIHCAGDLDQFAALMNQKAVELGMRNSCFCNPHGLNADNHYSTARDMGILTCAAVKNETFSEIVSAKTARVRGCTVKNHNRMLWSYEGADGVKTGYTKDAGRCLVSSATRDGMRLVAVTLHDHSDWKEHAAMLDYGFAAYTLKSVGSDILAMIPVLGGEAVPVRAAAPGKLLLRREDADRLEMCCRYPQYLWAPVGNGQQVGVLTITLDSAVLAEVPLIAGR